VSRRAACPSDPPPRLWITVAAIGAVTLFARCDQNVKSVACAVRALKTRAAMVAGVADYGWTIEDVAGLGQSAPVDHCPRPGLQSAGLDLGFSTPTNFCAGA
jgi:hypothetical protein